MEIVSLSKDFHKDWDIFCMKSDDAWFWHTTEWMEYLLNYKPDLKNESLYFFVKEKNKILAIVPLAIENTIFKDKKCTELSFGGSALPAPALHNDLDKKNRSKILNFIFEYIDSLAAKYNILRVTYKFSPLAPSFIETDYPQFNYLMRYSFIDASSSTRIIDLQKSKGDLWEDIRRNHKRGIDKIKNNFEILIYTEKNITQEIFDAYRLMHKKAAGRVTRPLSTFEKMHQWIRDGSAILTASKDKEKNKYNGFEYYSIYKKNVYGFSAANDQEYSSIPIRHLIEWETMMWLKERGYKYYEIGQEYYGPHLHNYPSDKEINISGFKQGFGGFAVPFFIGEKYYSTEYFNYTMNARVKKFIEKYNWNIKQTICEKSTNNNPKKIITSKSSHTRQELEIIVKTVIAENPGIIADYQAGKTPVINHVMGLVKRKIGERINNIDYQRIREIFEKEIKK